MKQITISLACMNVEGIYSTSEKFKDRITFDLFLEALHGLIFIFYTRHRSFPVPEQSNKRTMQIIN